MTTEKTVTPVPDKQGNTTPTLDKEFDRILEQRKEAIIIPQHLIIAGARFILVAPKEKRAIENNWPLNNYDSQSPRLIEHLAAGGNYGVLSRNGICCIDIDNPTKFNELGITLPPSFGVQRGGGKSAHYYFKCPDCPDDMKTKHTCSWGDIRLGGNFYTVGANCIAPSKDNPPVLLAYEIDNDVPIHDAPWALIEGILRASGTDTSETTPIDKKVPLITAVIHHQELLKYVGNQVRLNVPLAAIHAAVSAMNKDGLLERVRDEKELIREVDDAWGYCKRTKKVKDDEKERIKEERHIILQGGIITPQMKNLFDTNHAHVSIAHCLNLLIGMEASDGGIVRWNKDQKSWFHWNGSHWEGEEDGGFILKYTEQFLYKAMKDAVDASNKSFIITLLNAQSVGNVKAAMIYLKEMVSIPEKDFDRNQSLFNVGNGTIDLTTGELKPFDKTDFITRIGNVDFDKDASAQKWDKHLELIIPDAEIRKAFQVYMGYTLLGGNAENTAVFFYGGGKNGKTETINTMTHIFGSYAMTSQPQTFYERVNDDGPRPDIARMKGARFIGIPEGKKGKPLDEGLLKQLTGGDIVTARYLYGREFEFVPTGSLVFYTNHLPKISGRDVGVWRRIFPIPFKETIPAEKRKRYYHKILVSEESSGILNWMLEGLKIYQRTGGLYIPKAIIDAKEAYKAQEDVLADFLSGYIITSEASDIIKRSELYEAYKLNISGDSAAKPYTKMKFNSLMSERVGDAVKYRDAFYWVGIRPLKAGETQKQVSEF